MPTRRTLAVASAAIAVLAATACSSEPAATGDSSDQPRKGGTLTLLAGDDPTNMDPITAYQATNRLLSYTTTRYLFAYRPGGRPADQAVLHPDIAREIPDSTNGGVSEDGKTVTIHLRDGVQWSTEPARTVVAGDFVRQLKMLCNPVRPVPAPTYYTATLAGMTEYCAKFAKVQPTVAGIKDFVEKTPLAGVEAPDDKTLVFHLTEGASDFPNVLALEFSAARPVEYLDHLPESKELREHLLADGPYRIASYRSGVSMKLERNPAWSKDSDPIRSAHVDGIEIKFGLGADNAVQQIKAGTADLGFGLRPPSGQIPQLLAAKDPNLAISEPASTQFLILNNRTGPMARLEVRQAVAAAIDKSVLQQLGGGTRTSDIADQVPLPNNAGHLELRSDSAPSGPQAARDLLTRAGYSGPVPITMVYSNGTGEAALKSSQAYQAALEAAGFKVTLKPLTDKIFVNDYMRNPAAATARLWDVAPGGWSPDWAGNNGRSSIVPIFTQPGAGAVDFSGYHSDEFDTRVAAALSAPTAAAAAPLWAKANEQLLADLPVVPVLYARDAIYHSSRVEGCTPFWYGRSCALTELWLAK